MAAVPTAFLVLTLFFKIGDGLFPFLLFVAVHTLHAHFQDRPSLSVGVPALMTRAEWPSDGSAAL